MIDLLKALPIRHIYLHVDLCNYRVEMNCPNRDDVVAQLEALRQKQSVETMHLFLTMVLAAQNADHMVTRFLGWLQHDIPAGVRALNPNLFLSKQSLDDDVFTLNELLFGVTVHGDHLYFLQTGDTVWSDRSDVLALYLKWADVEFALEGDPYGDRHDAFVKVLSARSAALDALLKMQAHMAKSA